MGRDKPDQRAGLLAALFIVAYLAFSVPALIAGVATTRFGLHSTALVYSASLAALVAAGTLLLRPGGTPARPVPVPHALLLPGQYTAPPGRSTDPADGNRAATVKSPDS